MALSLTDAQLDEIAQKIFVLGNPLVTRLPVPQSSTGSGSLAAQMETYGIPRNFPNQGIGVAYFPSDDFLFPRIWLQNPGAAWRIGSAAKLGILLAAVQLREEVRAIQRLNLLRTPEEYDELFALEGLWRRASDPGTLKIAGRAHAPRISTIFKFPGDGSGANFNGPDPDTPDAWDIVHRPPVLEAHLDWPHVWKYGFSELLWLTGAQSDNVAATSCLSEIGIAYVKAVQRAYGLWREAPSDMRMLLGDRFSQEKVPTTSRVSNGSNLKHRPLQDMEKEWVGDALLTRAGYTDQLSSEGGTAAALLAYLIAMQQGRFGKKDNNSWADGEAASTTIRQSLAGDPGGGGTRSPLVEGVASFGTIVTYTRHKLGFLSPDVGEKTNFLTDFAYVETADIQSNRKLKFGIVVTNVAGESAWETATRIGKAINDALISAWFAQ